MAVGQIVPGVEGLPENETQRYLEMRKRLPTIEVNGSLITHGAVEDRMRSIRRTDFFSTYKEYEDTKPAAFRAMARDQLVDEEIALQEARKRGIGLAQGEAEAVADQFLPNDPIEAQKAMDKHGILDQQALLDRSGRNAIIDKVMTQVSADFPEPTQEEMRAFYEANSRVFEVTPEMALARRIFIVIPKGAKSGTLEYAELIERTDRLIDRLKDGEDFAELADRNTEDPEGIGVGGSMGWIKRGELATEMDEPLFNQEVGVLPDRAFRSVGGFNILLIEDKKPPVLQPFEEAIPRIQRGIRVERFKEWLAEKRRNAQIVYYEDLPMKQVLEGEYPKKTEIAF
jgi:parvulin-like peptidyl-prolyl isomerase